MLDLILSQSVQETCCEACFHHQRECYKQRMDAETIEQREARLAWRQQKDAARREELRLMESDDQREERLAQRRQREI